MPRNLRSPNRSRPTTSERRFRSEGNSMRWRGRTSRRELWVYPAVPGLIVRTRTGLWHKQLESPPAAEEEDDGAKHKQRTKQYIGPRERAPDRLERTRPPHERLLRTRPDEGQDVHPRRQLRHLRDARDLHHRGADADR